MVIIANSLFIAKSSTGCQKLFLLLGGLSSLHTKKNAYFLFKKNLLLYSSRQERA